MSKANRLNRLKQRFEKHLPKADARSPISPLQFVVIVVFSFFSDTKKAGLEGIRRHLEKQTKRRVSRSAFWERLAAKRLKTLLQNVLSALLAQTSQQLLAGKELLKTLGVEGIVLVDSCSFTLWDGAKEDFPGTRTTAGIKWHLCFDLLAGHVKWSALTPTTTHDRKRFPRWEQLKGKLVIVDLGYWDIGLFLAIQTAGAFFLSRIKSSAVLTIEAVVQGLPAKYIGTSLLALPLKRKRGAILELEVSKKHKGETLRCRAIGFWNPAEKCYHWYLTNLLAPAHLIYPLYRLRWQIELVFKACKQSFNAARITSNNSNIIESLLLASIVAQMASHTILHLALPALTKAQQLAISFQRLAKVTAQLADELIQFLTRSSRSLLRNLLELIHVFVHDIFDPNYKHRNTTLANVHRLLQ